MKYSIKSKIIATIIASAMVLPMALSACATSTTDSGDEWTITLNYNDGESRNNYIYVDKEEGNVKIPDTPVRAGYTFAGWYTQAEGGQEVDISTLTNSDSPSMLIGSRHHIPYRSTAIMAMVKFLIPQQ